jgi:hypothetical protein
MPSAEEQLQALLTGDLPPGVAEFDIVGAGHWFVIGETKAITRVYSGPRTFICRASAGDFAALLGGRMSIADAILTDRMTIAGDAAAIARWSELLG